jgi:hypothetical protein
MDSDLKDWSQIGAWAIASIGGVIAAGKAVWEIRRSRIDREAEFRWKRAELGKSVLDEIWKQPLARSALRMLDWTGLTYPRGDQQTGVIDHALMFRSLRPTSGPFSPDEQFVRDCFDELFDGFERLEHFVQIRLILFEDIDSRLRYYISLLARNKQVYQKFLKKYGFILACALLERFESWKPASSEPAVSFAEKPSQDLMTDSGNEAHL